MLRISTWGHAPLGCMEHAVSCFARAHAMHATHAAHASHAAHGAHGAHVGLTHAVSCFA